jgi:hypothetical protein
MGANQQLMLSESGGLTYATWDPAHTGSLITLSGGNLVASETGGVSQFTRSTISKSSGKWYWEVVVTSYSGDAVCVGIANSIANPEINYLGQTLNSWSYGSDGNYYHNGTQGGIFTPYGSSAVIGVALDMGGGTMDFYLNNTHQTTQITGISGTIFAAATPSTGANATITAKFGPSLTYTPPAGYNAGLYQ